MLDFRKFLFNNLPTLQGIRIFFPEPNPTFENPAFDDASLRVLIVRLSPLQNIKDSTSHHFLFQEVRRALPFAFIDYAFLPDPKNMPIFRNNNIPFFIGIQSFRPIADFDVVLISNSFILELINLPLIFTNSGIPAIKSERTGKPIIIMGGSNALMAQSSISKNGDSCIDALFFGEGESSAGRIISIIQENRDIPGEEILKLLEQEVPGFFDIRLPIPYNLRIASPAVPELSNILTIYPILNTDIETTAKLQITRGCPCFCSFCFDGMTRKPFREYRTADIYEKAIEIKTKHATSKLDLLSFNFNLHSGISEIITELNRLSKFVNFMSQRADIIAARPELLDLEVLSGKRTFTIGIEGVSDRMRHFLHKSLSDAEIFFAIEQIYARKPRQLKLFFIITGKEESKDLKEFKDLIIRIKNLKTRLSPGCRTIMSIGLLTNLPFTPMQFKAIIDPAGIKQIKGNIKRDCETNGFEFRMAQDMEDYMISQHLVLAGHECFDVLMDFSKNGGYFDGEHLVGDKMSLLSSLKAASGDAVYEEKTEDYIFPFERIKGTLNKSFLFRMYKEAAQFQDNGYCLEGKGLCIGCGGCDDHRLSAVPKVQQIDISRLKMTVEKKKKPGIAQAFVTIKEKGRFLTPESKCAFAGRALLERIPSLARDYLSCRQVQNIPASKGYGLLFGKFLFDFEFLSGSEIFLELIEKETIDTQLLGISGARIKHSDEELRFLITSVWNDAGAYSFQNKFQEFLLGGGMGFDISKSEGMTYFQIATRDKKKKMVYSAILKQEKDQVKLELGTGPKFMIITLLKHLFEDMWLDAKVELK